LRLSRQRLLSIMFAGCSGWAAPRARL